MFLGPFGAGDDASSVCVFCGGSERASGVRAPLLRSGFGWDGLGAGGLLGPVCWRFVWFSGGLGVRIARCLSRLRLEKSGRVEDFDVGWVASRPTPRSRSGFGGRLVGALRQSRRARA